MVKISSAEITPEHVFLNRRRFMAATGVMAGSVALAACSPATLNRSEAPAASIEPALAVALGQEKLPAALAYTEPTASVAQDELGDPLNNFQEIVNYNNYYEFSTNKEVVAKEAANFTPAPWQVEVTGLVNQPMTFGHGGSLQPLHRRRSASTGCAASRRGRW
jgi:sulfoxide reductase catalytic subunit YedY